MRRCAAPPLPQHTPCPVPPRCPPPLRAAEALPALPLVPSGPLSFEDAVLLYLRYMSRTGDHACSLMESQDQRLKALERDMAAIRAAILVPAEDGACSATGSTNHGTGGAAAAATPRLPEAARSNGWGRAVGQQRQQLGGEGTSMWSQPVSLRQAVIWAGLLSTVTAAATTLYFKRQQAK